MSRELDDTIGQNGPDGAAPSLGIELSIGQPFAGRYEVEDVIGRGGMGAVYRVRDRALGEVVALKLLTLSSDRAVERFRAEVRLARRVTHPNVARIHDFGEAGEVRYLTMECVEGRSLDDILDVEKRLEPERAARVARDIAAGLAAAHAAGIVHRDLKPANVLVADDGRVVLTDFGIARAMESTAKTHDTGMLLGTPHYMAPEQVSGRPVDERSDIYAFGLILFELLTGELPFGGETPIAVAAARMHQDPEDLRKRASVPGALAQLVMVCIARDPDRRPSSITTIKGALDTYLGEGSAATPTGISQSLYAPIVADDQTLAVLPFTYRGSAEHDYFGEGLAEELIDVLSRTRGLRVLSLGATRRFASDRDPATIAAELGADSVVDGTVQLAGGRVRITARLVDATSSVQRWNDRFDGTVEDIFTLQESMGGRIAEALRLEVHAAAHGQSAPREAVELYLRARRLLRRDVMIHAVEALEHLDRCVELAPEFAPGLAAHAVGSVRAWWGPLTEVISGRKERAIASVARAVDRAPDLAETHLASAMLAVQTGKYREAAQALGRALSIAPTMPEAQQYLGEMQVEAGRLKEGRKRLALALALDPTHAICHLSLARVALYADDLEEFEHHSTALLATDLSGTLPILVTQLRWALYRGDRESARAIVRSLEALGDGSAANMATLAKIAVGEGDRSQALAALSGAPTWLDNPRFDTLIKQIGAEIFCAAGELELAAEVVAEAADSVLIDSTWMDHCSLLAPLRDTAAFSEAREKVQRRAADVWRR